MHTREDFFATGKANMLMAYMGEKLACSAYLVKLADDRFFAACGSFTAVGEHADLVVADLVATMRTDQHNAAMDSLKKRKSLKDRGDALAEIEQALPYWAAPTDDLASLKEET